ncbi:glycosyltransferase [Bartonella sp. DGB2]|uniref:glycosyltransferase n=1 Tax=Bartonella sp. DGB2 TaxID=3388426 RepID=UPI00398F8FF0
MPDYMVIIPAQNEEERIEACLEACYEAMRNVEQAGRILLVVNNSTDATRERARNWVEQHTIALDILDIELPSSKVSASMARALGFDVAMTSLGPRGLLLTTDADSIVDALWIKSHLAAARRGVGVVCGKIAYDKAETALLPTWLLYRQAVEEDYAHLSRALICALDPDPANPWPHHGDESAANMAITSQALEQIGGAPRLHEGGAIALVQRAMQHDLTVFYCAQSKVTVSMRLKGRDKGGMAAALTARLHEDDYYCERRLENVPMLIRRYRSRHILRSFIKNEQDCEHLLLRFGLSPSQCRHALHHYSFGAMWFYIEEHSSFLSYVPLRFSALQAELPRLILAVESQAKALGMQERFCPNIQGRARRQAPIAAFAS